MSVLHFVVMEWLQWLQFAVLVTCWVLGVITMQGERFSRIHAKARLNDTKYIHILLILKLQNEDC